MCTTRIDLSSDHVPAIANLDVQPIYKQKSYHLTNKTTNWNKFATLIENSIDLKIRLKDGNDIQEAVNNLTATIQNACSSCTWRRQI